MTSDGKQPTGQSHCLSQTECDVLSHFLLPHKKTAALMKPPLMMAKPNAAAQLTPRRVIGVLLPHLYLNGITRQIPFLVYLDLSSLASTPLGLSKLSNLTRA
jgi:hypothetical protein